MWNNKYIKLKSRAWWAGLALVAPGAFVLSTPLHGQIALSETVVNFSGMSGYTMFISGLGLWGVRGMN